MTQRDRLLDHIRRLALHGMGERRTDGQLLELFISERDEAAFALLLRRHGAMVWSVCRRVLGNAHDADDAFQATFLVLVRKADSIRPREAVGNWLYGVAYRTALEARGRIARRRAKEQPLQDVPSPENGPQEQCQELWPILDRELSRLADKYRLPIVLCDLEGRSRKDVARQLAIPEGTLSSRLAMGRKKLAARLARYGFAVTAASLGTLLTEKTATASLSLSLMSATTKAALLVAAGSTAVAGAVSATVSTLTEGVLKAMFIAKIKTATLVLCSVAALGVGTGGVYYQTRVGAADSPQAEQVVQDNRKRNPEPRERDIGRLKRENDELRKALAEAQSEKQEQHLIMKKRDAEARTLEAELGELKRRLAAERAHRGQRTEPDQKPGPNPALANLERMRREVITDVNKRAQLLREQMENELKQLEEAARLKLAELDQMKEKIVAEQAANQPKNNPVQKPVGDDKLDQILQRLERLEKRLDRLERDRKP